MDSRDQLLVDAALTILELECKVADLEARVESLSIPVLSPRPLKGRVHVPKQLFVQARFEAGQKRLASRKG